MAQDYDDDYDEEWEDDEEEAGSLVLAIGEDGKATIRKPEDYVEVLASEMKLISGFLEENKDAFSTYMKKHDVKQKEKEVKEW